MENQVMKKSFRCMKCYSEFYVKPFVDHDSPQFVTYKENVDHLV